MMMPLAIFEIKLRLSGPKSNVGILGEWSLFPLSSFYPDEIVSPHFLLIRYIVACVCASKFSVDR